MVIVYEVYAYLEDIDSFLSDTYPLPPTRVHPPVGVVSDQGSIYFTTGVQVGSREEIVDQE